MKGSPEEFDEDSWGHKPKNIRSVSDMGSVYTNHALRSMLKVAQNESL